MLKIAKFAQINEEVGNMDYDNSNINNEKNSPGRERDNSLDDEKLHNERFDAKPDVRSDERFETKPINTADLASDLDSIVIPSEFQYGEQVVRRKGVKNTYYCDICYVELSSTETMKSHSNGSKHQGKTLQLKKEREEKIRMGLLDPNDKMPGIRQVPNPVSLKVKIPTRLQEKIKETKEPVVGLSFIKEFLTESDPEMEPHYVCNLCGSVGTSNGMFSHIMGSKHRQAFATSKGGRRDMSQVVNIELNVFFMFLFYYFI